MTEKPAFLFDLDGTLVDSVYQHVLAWRDALDEMRLELRMEDPPEDLDERPRSRRRPAVRWIRTRGA